MAVARLISAASTMAVAAVSEFTDAFSATVSSSVSGALIVRVLRWLSQLTLSRTKQVTIAGWKRPVKKK